MGAMKYLDKYRDRPEGTEISPTPYHKQPSKPSKAPFEGFEGSLSLGPREIREHNEAARGTLDDYFRGVVMPGLTALFRDGRLPEDGLSSPAWREVEAAWALASEDSPSPCPVEKVKALMRRFVEGKGGTVPETPFPGPSGRNEDPIKAVTIRHGRTGQEAVILSTVLDSWLADGWEVKGDAEAHDVDQGEAIEARPEAEHGPKTEGGGV